MDLLASTVSLSATIGDVARAHDGTIYFISGLTSTSATIGRRVTCGSLELDWLSVAKPIAEIEISSDDWLYMSSTVAGTGTLVRIDLASSPLVPEQVASTPGQRIHDLSAGPNRRMFFIQGATSEQAIHYTDGGAVKLSSNVGGGAVGITATPDGGAFVFQDLSSTRTIGRLTITNGLSNLTKYALQAEDNYSLNGLRADAVNGLYVFRVIEGSPKTFRLYHTDTLNGLRSQTLEVVGGTRARPVFAVDGDPTQAALIIPDGTTQLTMATLPVAVFTP